MTTYLIAILSLAIGGLISWVIAHNSRVKQLDDAENEIGLHGTINQHIEACWKAITATENMKYFHITHNEGFGDATNAIATGTIIKSKFFTGNQIFHQYVCEWEPPRLFAFGYNQEDWHHHIELKTSGEKTNIFLKRRFKPRYRKWYSVLEDKITGNSLVEENRASLTYVTLQNIINICENRPSADAH